MHIDNIKAELALREYEASGPDPKIEPILQGALRRQAARLEERISTLESNARESCAWGEREWDDDHE